MPADNPVDDSRASRQGCQAHRPQADRPRAGGAGPLTAATSGHTGITEQKDQARTRMPQHLSPTLVNWASILEDKTRDQALAAATMPFVFPHIALMPDAHLGKGATVGSVIPTERRSPPQRSVSTSAAA
jgi:hypothetical protein